jgi:hypothetical protein
VPGELPCAATPKPVSAALPVAAVNAAALFLDVFADDFDGLLPEIAGFFCAFRKSVAELVCALVSAFTV